MEGYVLHAGIDTSLSLGAKFVVDVRINSICNSNSTGDLFTFLIGQ